jgi:uncharacterized protein YcgI (DUF1989 family)
MKEVLVKAATGHAFTVPKGGRFKVVDLEGRQVSDLVAFVNADVAERLSPANTRKLNGSLRISRSGILYSTRCRPLLRIVEDTVGEHDLLFSSCSADDYRVRFGLTTPHASCLGILVDVLAPFGIPESVIPDPFNIFQRTAVLPDGKIETLEPLSKPGDFVEFEAAADCVVALTACPQDQNPCNGWRITDVKVVFT